MRCFEKSFNLGCIAGMYNLAQCYENGEGVAQNKMRAASYYERVAEEETDDWKGDALYALGNMYGEGVLGGNDHAETAVKYYRKAAELGSIDAMKMLAFCYEIGLGVPEDKKRAINLYKNAARAGDEEARKRLEELKKDNGSLVKDILGFFS